VAALVAFAPVQRGRIVDGYVLLGGGLLLLALVRATGSGGADGPSRFDRALRRRPPTADRPRDLARIERAVVLARSSSFDVHVRVRPHLREIAAHRLASRRGLDLDSGSPEVRALLGPGLWELVRPDRPPPHDRFAPGLPLADVRAALDALERI
jgi:hypothetical protein